MALLLALLSLVALASRSMPVAVALLGGLAVGWLVSGPSAAAISRAALDAPPASPTPGDTKDAGSSSPGPLVLAGPLVPAGPLVLAGVATIALLTSRYRLGAAALAAAVATALILRTSPRARSLAEGAIRAVQRLVGLVVSRGLFGLLGLLILPISWFGQALRGPVRGRPQRWEPTMTGLGAGSAGGSPSHGSRSIYRRRRVGRRLAVAATVLAVLVGAGYVALRRAFTPSSEIMEAPAMAASPWWPELSRAQSVTASVTRSEAWGIEVLPYALKSPYLNVERHRRVTWKAAAPQVAPQVAPSAAECPPVEIWAFGGSTMFGYGQRDDHTVASYLAKELNRRGLRSTVLNFGVPGDTLWIETRKLEGELLAGSNPPDLVVFYDGVNEYGAQELLGAKGRAGTPPLAAFEDAGMYDGFARAQAVINRFVTPNQGIETDMYGPDAGATNSIDATATQYRRSIESSRRLIESYGTEAVWFLQPVRATRARGVPAENSEKDVLSDDRSRQAFAAMAEEGRGAKANGVTFVDLRAAMDAESGPVFYDGIHTNERGAELVATAMAPQVLAVLNDRDLPPCGVSG
jgi:lysophospholipase L1-like esterase